MILSESILLAKQFDDWAQAIIESGKPINIKLFLRQRSIGNLFAQIYAASKECNILSDKRTKDFLEFLGSKVNALNKNEYLGSVKLQLENHFLIEAI